MQGLGVLFPSVEKLHMSLHSALWIQSSAS